MSVEEMREAIKKVYDGNAWKCRCELMPAYQVIAIYYSFRDKGKFKKKKKVKEETFEQLTIFDILKEENKHE